MFFLGKYIEFNKTYTYANERESFFRQSDQVTDSRFITFEGNEVSIVAVMEADVNPITLFLYE